MRRVAEASFFLLACFSAGWLPLALAINLSPQDPEITAFGWFLVRIAFVVPAAVVIAAFVWARRVKPNDPISSV